MLELLGAVALVTVAWHCALQRAFIGTFWPFVIVGVPYAAMAALYAIRAAKAGVLSERLRPRSGDLTFGAIAAAMLFAAAMLGRALLARPGSVRGGWLVQIYLHVGEPGWVAVHLLLLTVLVLVLALLEEIAWRGYVMSLVDNKLGSRGAWPITAILNTLAYAAAVYQLRDPFAGPNPLVVIAGLGCGLVWGFVVARTRRLPVAAISHAMFAWAVFVQFPLLRLAQ